MKIHKIQHVPLKLDQEEVKRLQKADPQNSEMIESIKTENKVVSGDVS